MADLLALTHTGDRIVLKEATVREFEGRLAGSLLLPGHAGYDEGRSVWNGMIDHRPACIVRCAGRNDVITTVNFARNNGLLVSVRGGGHNVAGNAVCDGGLVIDLSEMKGVVVDSANQTIRAEGGATIGDLDRATQAYGLAVPMGVVTETGIAGLTLGGGLGWLRRKYGLSSDNLISADVVTADGRYLKASEEEHPDLFWGLRGGGGNFGIVTSFEFQAYPVGPDVFVAFVIHPYENAKAVLQSYREWAATAPDEISSFGILWHAPEMEEIPAGYHHQPIVVLLAMYSDDPADGERALGPLRDMGQPVVDLSGVMPYLEFQQFFDEDYPAGEMHYYWKSAYLNGLSDEVIDRLIDINQNSPSPHSTLDIWQLGGAMSRIDAMESAFGDRSAPFLLGIEANWEDPAADAANIAWARQAYSLMEPYSTGAEYLNFPGLYEESDQMVRNSFGKNYARLVELKNKYDPTNFFQLNQNIKATTHV
jgi:FAD/FMN-containing dehydrogenase